MRVVIRHFTFFVLRFSAAHDPPLSEVLLCVQAGIIVHLMTRVDGEATEVIVRAREL